MFFVIFVFLLYWMVRDVRRILVMVKIVVDLLESFGKSMVVLVVVCFLVVFSFMVIMFVLMLKRLV